MWARVENGSVAEITDKNPSGRFHPALEWVECSADVKPGWNHDGEVFLPPPGPNYAKRRDRELTRIDTAAGAARLRYVSAGLLIEEEYRRAKIAVQEWRAAGSPGDSVPPEIQSGAEYSGITHEEAAAEIEETAATWEGVLAQIRNLRLGGKAAVRMAADSAIETTALGYIEQLEKMVPTE